ncbi:hypothetical protein C8R43DRAFT_1144573 [Mycena crocata]|nr:hypothetical protein C8R43DRAFT_1144573 [Mycena crocata]
MSTQSDLTTPVTANTPGSGTPTTSPVSSASAEGTNATPSSAALPAALGDTTTISPANAQETGSTTVPGSTGPEAQSAPAITPSPIGPASGPLLPVNPLSAARGPSVAAVTSNTSAPSPLPTGQGVTCAMLIPDGDNGSSVGTEALIDTIGGSGTVAPRAIAKKLDQLWENGTTITYSFIGGSANQQFKVTTMMKNWVLFANITFVLVPEAGMLRISFDPNAGSWSYVGRVNQTILPPKPTMNLSGVFDVLESDLRESMLIMHQLGHVLGLMHEWEGPASGGGITLDEEAACAYYKQTLGWDEQTTRTQIIDVYNSGSVSNYTTPDCTSIMAYFLPASLNQQRRDILVSNFIQKVPLDYTWMVLNYPLPTPSDGAPSYTLDFALQTFGIDSATAQAIRNANSEGGNTGITKMRAIFHTWLITTRLAPPSDPAHGADAGPDSTEEAADLMWCGTSDLLDEATDTSSALNDVLRGISAGSKSSLWYPAERILYGFINPDEATPHRRQRIADVFALYMRNSSLRFNELPDAQFGSLDFAKADDRNQCQIRIWFGPAYTRQDPTTGKTTTLYGEAEIGTNQTDGDLRSHGSLQNYDEIPQWTTIFLSLQPFDDDKEIVNEKQLLNANRVLYHEIGHALGLMHGHASSRSGDDVESPTPTEFDYKSVMLYSYLPYTPALSPWGMRINPSPSASDLDLLRLLYPDSGETEGKFAEALITMDFEPDEQRSLLDLAKSALPRDSLGMTRIRLAKINDLRRKIAENLRMDPRLSIRKREMYDPSGKLSPPARDTGRRPATPPRDAAPDPPRDTTSIVTPPAHQAPGFLMELVDALKQFFNPGGNQMFTLQFPGRFLDQSSYAWDTSAAGVYGQFIKPTAVNEAEFRLVDQLYDSATNVGGPNGTNLSIVYEQMLNNLLPKYVENGLAEQQDSIRQWLMKDVPMTQWIGDIMARQQAREQSLATAIAVSMGTNSPTAGESTNGAPVSGLAPGAMFDISGKSTTNGEMLNRIELSELLMNEYLYAKQDWEVERDGLISKASEADLGTSESQKALNALTRQLAHITDTRQAQLASKYADAVVRGYSHNVRQYMGYLDISNPAEALQDAKDSLREAAMSSLDGSMKVYPVQLTPLDWFAGLSTSFTLEDLTQDPGVIRLQIKVKSNELDTLNAQLVALQMGAKGDPTELQNKVQAAQTALDNAQGDLAQTYSNNVIAMAKTFLDAEGKVDTGELAGELGVAEAALAQLPEMMDAVQRAQNGLTSSSRALSQLMAAQALAQATDTKQQQQQLRLQIQSLTSDLKELQTRWQVLTGARGGTSVPTHSNTGPIADDEVPTGTLQIPEEQTSGGSRWQTITLFSSSTTREAMTKDHAEASSEQWSCNLWFASGSGSSSRSSAASTRTATATDDTIDLTFRATLVTVDRGGWFQPQFFQQSAAFHKVNPNIYWRQETSAGVKGLLPGFPIGYLIVKDVMIRVVHGASAAADSKQTDMAAAASSGGFLCFSYSSSRSSSSTATASSFRSYSNGYIIKIPGPQILGYMIQNTDVDNTELMPSKLPAGFFIPDDEYNKTVAGEDPAHGVDPGGPKVPATPPPTVTQDRLREVLDKMLNEKIQELFETAGPASGSGTS